MSAAAGLFARRPGWTGDEGPRPVLTIAPGVVALGWPDISRQERTAERAERTRQAKVDELARYRAEYCDDPAEAEPTRVISAWSAKSRARMVRVLAELDYGPLLNMGLRLPMTTLTYPGDWLTVAPSGQDVKRHMDKLRKRFTRAWGFDLVGIWKLEFQRRGAPHIHLWGPEPTGAAGDFARLTKVRRRDAVGDGLAYRQWLSVVWADIVDCPDPEERRRHQLAGTAVDFAEGDRMTDPRRLAVYFTKHGSYGAKEYQHEVPLEWREPGKTPGRFWGYWGLEKAAVGVELSPADAVFVGRTMRRLSRSHGTTREVTVARTPGGVAVSKYHDVVGLAGLQYLDPAGPTVYRTVRRRAVRLGGGAGFLCLNDAPSVAAQLARALERQGADEERRRSWERAGEERIRRLELRHRAAAETPAPVPPSLDPGERAWGRLTAAAGPGSAGYWAQ